jgi:hypothetical protein
VPSDDCERRVRGADARRPQSGLMRWPTVALLFVAVVVSSCGEDGVDGEAGGTTTSTKSATTSDATTDTEPAPALESALVMAGSSGVQIVSPDGISTSVVRDPAAVAFGIGSDLVVFQNVEPRGLRFPPVGASPVRVWTGGEVRTLATDPDTRRAFLLDAAMIDGAPIVLVAERFGEVGFNDTFEELVQIDLRDDTRTTVVRRPAWESGHFAARLLPDRDVIGLFASEAHVLLARWTATSKEPIWSAEVGIHISVDLALRADEVTLIQPSFDTEQNFTPVLSISARDQATGDELSSDSIHIDDPDGEIDTGLFCSDWASPTAVVCGRAGGVPIVVSVVDGYFDRLPGGQGSIPTVVRPT